ncbi:MAG: M20/M25/M40 family metallo-hydrolase [bacterium]
MFLRARQAVLLLFVIHVLFLSTGGFCKSTTAPASSGEASRLLSEYLKADTSNPPGNEIRAALFFRKIFEREGIENEIFEYAPGRANFFAILRGNGGGIVLFNHSDVVPADQKAWSVDPFSGIIRDGFIYGRGALDMKGTAVMQMMAMILLKRNKVPLKRDIIFLSVADEECLSTGSEWMIKSKKDLLKGAEFLLNEGENIHPPEGERKEVLYAVSPTEKSPLWLRLTARGTPGHASEPNPDSAVNRLLGALQKIVAYQPPEVLLPAARTFIRDLRLTEAEFASSSYGHATTHNTIAVTGLKGSSNINVIPSEAAAEIDCRLLPGENPDLFTERLRSLISDENVDVKVLFSYPANASSTDTALFRAIEKAARRRDPGCIVTSPISTSSNDSHYFRELGITCYNFEPYRATDDENAGAHGDDERISLENMEFGTAFYYDVLVEMNRLP